MAEEKNLEGLRGWLLLVGLGIIIAPIRIIATTFSIYSQVFCHECWIALTTPGSEIYHPLWKPVLFGEIAINVGLLCVWIFIAFLFFSKKKIFPKWFIGTLLFAPPFILIDAWVVHMILPNEPIFDADTTKEFRDSLIGALIWLPYMQVSKRVKLTFVK